MLETATVTMASSFDRSLPVSKFDKFESGKSVWDAHRSIWQDNSPETETSRPNSVRHNSTSSNKFGRTMNGSALSTIENSRNISTDLNNWSSSNGGAVNGRQNSTLTSPTKRKQSGWLFDSKTHDVENSSNLLAGSAPEFEPFGETIPQEKLVTSRPVRLSDESLSYDGRFAPALRSTGPQLPAPNRLPPNAVQTNGVSHGIQNNTRSINGMVSIHDYRGRNDALPLDTSPPTSRGLATGSVRSNSNTISPTTSRFARQMNGYLDRTASTIDDTFDGFRALSINKGSSGYEKFGHFYDSQRPVINGEDDFALLGSTFEGGNYYRTSPYFGQEYLEQQGIPAWAYWSANDGKFRSDYAPEYRNGGNSPYHSSSLTPSSGTESIRSAVASRNSQHDMAMANRKSGTQDAYYQSAYQGNVPLDMAVRGHMNPLAPPYYMTNYVTGPRQFLAREEQRGAIHRSPLLEEFRINKSTKRYDLRDIFGHIVEFSGDQHGSRFIQQKLETANSDEKDQVFKEIQSEAMQLMTDVFGNYVIQKMFEHGSQSQKKVLAEYMKGRVAYLSTQMYGCRVVQKALEHVLTDQQASMVKELDGPNKAILKIIKDQNGNHVVQKAIERVPAEHIQFIIDAHKGEAVKLAQHTYGCRVIQRMLEHCTPAAKRIILDELHGCVGPLITDQFGNYVVQHIIQNGELADRRRVVSIVMQQLMHFSKHKFASNVVEKCLEFADEDQQRMMFMNLIQPDASGQSPVYGLLRDQYGNYVIQKVFNMLEGQQRVILEGEMRACFLQLKRTSYGKQVTAIEKLLYGNGHPMPATSIAPNGQLIAAPGRAAKH